MLDKKEIAKACKLAIERYEESDGDAAGEVLKKMLFSELSLPEHPALNKLWKDALSEGMEGDGWESGDMVAVISIFQKELTTIVEVGKVLKYANLF